MTESSLAIVICPPEGHGSGQLPTPNTFRVPGKADNKSWYFAVLSPVIAVPRIELTQSFVSNGQPVGFAIHLNQEITTPAASVCSRRQ